MGSTAYYRNMHCVAGLNIALCGLLIPAGFRSLVDRD
jgi:hypothetical protein